VLLTHSLKRKALVTGVAAVVFAGLYEVTALDSRYALFPSSDDSAPAPAPGSRMSFTATAYCKGVVTTSGVAVQNGVAAADPAVLPVGSIVQLDERTGKFTGVYTVLDTGPSVQGRVIDVYMWSCNEALAFGRQPVKLTVLRLGWNPKATTPPFMDRFFKRPKPGTGPDPLPSRPLPIEGS
jgi:3D (Asp-Asp-Asp) domain-containing protein